MKIGVTGSDHICDRIQKTLEKRMPDLSSAQSGFHLKSAGGICCPLFLRAGYHQYRYV